MRSKTNGMMLLTKKLLEGRISNAADNGQIFIDPLLDRKTQIGEVTVDLRLGYDFLVSIVTRNPSIQIAKGRDDWREPGAYYQLTRRDIGERFVLYPNQVVLGTTLEYIGLPSNVYADVLTRSTYNRLGIHLVSMVQPGFRGCFALEFLNHGNNPVELVVGSRIVQARFFELADDHEYAGQGRKYFSQVRPVAPKVSHDEELPRLDACRRHK